MHTIAGCGRAGQPSMAPHAALLHATTIQDQVQMHGTSCQLHPLFLLWVPTGIQCWKSPMPAVNMLYNTLYNRPGKIQCTHTPGLAYKSFSPQHQLPSGMTQRRRRCRCSNTAIASNPHKVACKAGNNDPTYKQNQGQTDGGSKSRQATALLGHLIVSHRWYLSWTSFQPLHLC
jgi:hypothetical protein